MWIGLFIILYECEEYMLMTWIGWVALKIRKTPKFTNSRVVDLSLEKLLKCWTLLCLNEEELTSKMENGKKSKKILGSKP